MESRTYFEQVEVRNLPKSEPYWVRTGNSLKHGQNGHSPLSKTLTLVVDDDRVLADTLVAIIRAKGFSALAAYDGKQGLEVARVLRPGVVISDILMPGINGVEMAKLIRELLPDTKIFLVSGHTSALTLVDNGPIPQDFVVLGKPLHPNELLGAVQEHLRPRN
ncbi:MAG: Chemotaxis regulator - transmits chemoreceptor signals to flagelllar motor component CheY [Acidobacteriales bacterium]|nr:Chemotaxis regulator - transmits chemoreceptor signals to flagelllar motor component CheY [Terriglobales bacterium]